MKRFIMICLMGWLGLAALMAQEATHDIKGVVTDKKQLPVVGALVRVEGTEISTVTDIDGKFLLREVPVTAKRLVVESIGMETEEWEINTPIQVAHKNKKYSLVVSAGVVMSRYTMNGGSFRTGYEIGVGFEKRLSKRWAFRPMVQLTNRGTVYKYNKPALSYEEDWNPIMIDVPFHFVNRIKLAYKTNLFFSFGPAISFGIGGKVKTETDGVKEELDIYDKVYTSYNDEKHALMHCVNYGVAYSLGVEHKKWSIGVWGKNMTMPQGNYEYFEHNWSLTFGVAYRFF